MTSASAFQSRERDPAREAETAGARPDDQPLDSAEAALVARARAGDHAAFERIVRDHAPRMLSVARRLLDCDAEAADAVQEAFIAAHRALDGFECTARLGTWLHRITVNAALMRLRSRKRHAGPSIDSLLPTFSADGHRENVRPAWSEPAERLLEREEARAVVRDCINMLPHEYRTVVVLRDIEELSTEETAQVLGIRAGAVKTRLHRARMALRELLERQFGPGSA